MAGHILALVLVESTLLAGIVEQRDHHVHPVMSRTEIIDYKGRMVPNVALAVYLRMGDTHHFLFDEREEIPVFEDCRNRVFRVENVDCLVDIRIHTQNVAKWTEGGN